MATNYREFRWFWVSNRPQSNPRAGDEHQLPDRNRRRQRDRAARRPPASFLRAVGFSDSPDGGLGILMSALAGVAAALAVAIVLSVYFHSGYRSRHDLLKHGLAASAVLVLLAFAISDMRQAALAYLGLNPAKPAAEFEIRLPKAVLTTAADTQVELLTRPEPETREGSGGAGLHPRRRPRNCGADDVPADMKMARDWYAKPLAHLGCPYTLRNKRQRNRGAHLL